MIRFLASLALILLASTASAGINSWTSVGPEGGDIQGLVITAGTPSLTYVRTPNAVYRSSDAGQTWSRANQIFGTTVDFAVHPTQTNRIFIVVDRDLLASSDGGATLAKVALPGEAQPAQVEFSADGALLYVKSARTIYRTTDFGATWTACAEVAPADVRIGGISIDPMDARRLIVATGAGLFITNDAGDHWSPFAAPGQGVGIEFSHSSPRIWALTADGLWYTTDAGANWTPTTLTRVINKVAVDPRDPSIIYAQDDTSVYRSNDAGASWTRSTGTLGLGVVNAFAFDPQASERVFIASSNGMFVSVDAGASWQPNHRGLVATTPSRLISTPDRTYFSVRERIHYLESGADATTALDLESLSQALPLAQFDQLLALHADRLQTGDRLFASGLRGGLARSMDGGQTWVRLADPLLNTTVQTLDVAPDNLNLLLAGTSNGVVRSTDGGDHWSTTSGIAPETYTPAVAFGPAGVAYAGGLHLWRSVDGGLNWSRADAGIPVPISIYELFIHGDATFVTTASGAYRTTDGGASWSALPVSGYFAADATGIYAAGSGISRSVDGGNTWNGIAPLAHLDPLDLQLDPNTRGRLVTANWYDGVQTFTIASDLTVTAAGQPHTAPASGARAQLMFTIVNRGPYAVTDARLNINVASGRALFENSDCSVSPSTRSQASCALGVMASGQTKVVRIESSFETPGPMEITASVAANEVDLTAADNTFTGSWSYHAPSNSSGGGGGGGGALSWWMLVALTTLTVARSPRRASPKS